MEQQPLCSLARNEKTMDSGYGSGMFVWGLIWFIIIVIIVWLILLGFKPSWIFVPNADGTPSGVINYGALLLWSVLIALIIMFIIWLIYAAVGYGNRGTTVVYAETV